MMANSIDRPVPTKGIHVQSTMKWLFNRLINNLGYHTVPPPLTFNSDPSHYGGGSENMKLLYCVCGFVGGMEKGRERLINWYWVENGHGGGEPLTVSHAQLHLGGHCAAALHAYNINDADVLTLALNWLNIEYNLYTLCEVDGEPWTPGARGVKKDKATGEETILGSNPTRGLFLRAVEGRKINKPNQYDLGAHCVAKLNDQLCIRISAPIREWSAIPIQGDLKITRYKDATFHAVFNSLPIGGGGVQAAGWDGRDKWIYRDAKEGTVTQILGTYVGPVLKSIELPTVRSEKPRVIKSKPTTSSLPLSIPSTCPELMEAANLPYSKAVGPISQANSQLVINCFSALYPNWGHPYMHASDHKAALVILLGREPTFREVQDSAHLKGATNINAAKAKSGLGENRPEGWDDWSQFQKKLAVLTHLYGISTGSRIADGKRKDPDPEKTKALMVLWGLKEEVETGEPIDPVDPKPVDPKPIDPPVDPSVEISGEIRIKVAGVERVFTLVEKKG